MRVPPETCAETVDVCIVVEGAYPYVAGGVSSWLDWLFRVQSDVTFGVVALTADETPRTSKYDIPENVKFLKPVPLARKMQKPRLRGPALNVDGFAEALEWVLSTGSADAFATLVDLVETPVRKTPFAWLDKTETAPSYEELLNSQAAWDIMVRCYRRLLPHASFPDFFWAWRNLVGGLFSVLTEPIPQARAYHTISTGYAGLFAARAALSTDRPAAITEHGIYTNERRIDLVTADWIEDSVASGLSGLDDREDIRGFWARSFECYARTTYALSTKITTLYGANQTMQRALGAEEDRMQVIPNGIDLDKFESSRIRVEGRRPTAALLGRVVPIKDVEAFIDAAAVVRARVPDAQMLVLGPTDEDPEYYERCKKKVADLGLEDTVIFKGKVNIFEYLPKIDVMVLTSISEAQPLVLLEAGAAGIPCVATDVGSCREIIEGAPAERPNLGRAGRIAPAMDSAAIGEGIVELLADPRLRAECGAILMRRVEQHFTSDDSAARYLDLYKELWAA